MGIGFEVGFGVDFVVLLVFFGLEYKMIGNNGNFLVFGGFICNGIDCKFMIVCFFVLVGLVESGKVFWK